MNLLSASTLLRYAQQGLIAHGTERATMHTFPTLHTAPASKTRTAFMLAVVLAHIFLVIVLQRGAAAQRPQPRELTIQLITPSPENQRTVKDLPNRLEQPKFASHSIPLPRENAIFATPMIDEATAQAPSVQQPINLAPTTNASATAPVARMKLVSAVEYLRSPQADYPALARRMGEQGKVVMQVQVNEQGKAEKVDIQQSSGFNRLDEAARLAMMRALFKPHIEDGKPLAILAIATINFSLNG